MRYHCGRAIAGQASRRVVFVLALLAVALLILRAAAPEQGAQGVRAHRGMVRIPAGAFTMGTNETDSQGRSAEFGIIKPWFEDEHPAHRVVLPAYTIDRYETTNAAYAEFIADTGHSPPAHWPDGRLPAGLSTHPVVNVSWEDASAYCRWAGKRLPTEAEWERAARGPDGRRYPWGNAFDPARAPAQAPALANVGGITSGTMPVGSYPQSQSIEGVHDLIGNVWEWTADWYAPYPGSDAPREKNEQFGRPVKVLRGSSFSTVGHYPVEAARLIIAHNARGSFRLFFDPFLRVNDVGLRCARSL